MDIIYVTRDGENPELRYSLRTLSNLERFDRVWVFGDAPTWVDISTLTYVNRRQVGSPYASVRAHIKAACDTPEISDPFMLWNDDFYLMRPLIEVPVYHRGSLEEVVKLAEGLRTPWGKGLKATADFMAKNRMLEGAMSYDTHLPLIVHKAPMREALKRASHVTADAVHVRTLYGAIADLGGEYHVDPKMLRKSDPFPPGVWLSSGNDTFRTPVEPVLRYLFPDPSPYEKD